MKAAFHTLGCKVNQYETEAMKEQFIRAGYEIAEDGERADVYIINTCTVTRLADRKSRQFIRRAHKENPGAVVCVTGCYAQTHTEEAASLEGVEIVCGTDEKNSILKLLSDFFRERERGEASVNAGTDTESGREKRILVHPEGALTGYESQGEICSMSGRTRAFIKIEDGCDNFCSYCIIPHARGRVRSRPPEEIVSEVKRLVKGGLKEVVLTGINTACYGRDIGIPGIEPLIRMLNDIEGDFRIRLSSLEPTETDASQVRALLRYDRLCRHLHLALQSGSDKVLALMNRHYGMRDFRAIVDVLRGNDPLYGISTDIIVGFPGESEEDFKASVKAVRDSAFCKVHVFRYSPREGTPAASRKDQISPAVKRERSEELSGEAGEVARAFRKASVGSIREVLTERTVSDPVTGENEGTFLPHASGYTDNYLKTEIYGLEAGSEQFFNVRLTGVTEDGMTGEIIV